MKGKDQNHHQLSGKEGKEGKDGKLKNFLLIKPSGGKQSQFIKNVSHKEYYKFEDQIKAEMAKKNNKK